MWKEKLGNYLIDISKYTLTAIFIASLFKDLEEMKLGGIWFEPFCFCLFAYHRFAINK